jgi:hypothetical protein
MVTRPPGTVTVLGSKANSVPETSNSLRAGCGGYLPVTAGGDVLGLAVQEHVHSQQEDGDLVDLNPDKHDVVSELMRRTKELTEV